MSSPDMVNENTCIILLYDIFSRLGRDALHIEPNFIGGRKKSGRIDP